MSRYKYRIGMDVRCLVHERKSGVEFYVEDLVTSLPAQAKDIAFYFYADRRMTAKMASKFRKANAKIVISPFVNENKFWKSVFLHSKLTRLNLFHFPISIIPFDFKIPSVITVYDLTYEHYPSFYSAHELELQKTAVRDATHKAVAILTISESTKKDLVEFYRLPEDKIVVTYPQMRPIHKEKVLPRPPLAEPYFLFVGNIQPRKNLPNIVEAFAGIRTKHHLVIAGKLQDPEEVALVKQKISANNLAHRVHLVGYVSDQELTVLYKNAAALVLASFYEGFGYTIIEAFANRIPVITSRVSSMAEVAQEAAIYVDPKSIQSIQRAMENLLVDKHLGKQLVQKGSERLKKLAEQSPIQRTITTYTRVLK